MGSSSFKRTDQLSQGKGCHVYREKQRRAQVRTKRK